MFRKIGTFCLIAITVFCLLSVPQNQTHVAVAATCGTTNIALNKTATSSSNEAVGTTPNLAVDGNAGTRWGSAFSDPQWIQIDLGSTQSICQVILRWETAYGKSYQIQVSNDAATWTSIYSTTTGAGGVETLNVSGSGRYIRMYGTVRGTAYGYSLWEFEVYAGSSSPTNTPTFVPPTVTVVSGCGTTNIALNKTATSSSNENAGTTPNLAVDGNLGTRWSSAASDPQWIQIDLGSTQSICHVKLTWETAYGKSYQIQVSNDAATWTTIYSTTTGAGGVNDLTGLSGSGRYIRMNGTVRGTQYGYSLWEFEVYTGSSGPTTVPPTNTNTAVPTNTATFIPATNTPGVTPTSAGCGTTNVALNKTATASSVTGTNTAALAVDGNLGSRWESLYSDPQWIQIDLGATQSICHVKLTWETAAASAYQIQTSNDAATWTTIYSTTTGTGGVNDMTGLAGSGRYIRMNGTARTTQYGYSLWEFEVYTGTSGPTNTPTTGPTITSTLGQGAVSVPVSIPYVAYLQIGLSPADLNNTSVIKTQNLSQNVNLAYSNGASVTFSVTAWTPAISGQTAIFSAVDSAGVTHTGAPLTVTVYSGLVVNVVIISPTATPTVTSCGTTNIALNKTATASSVTGANTAPMAVDGNAGTRWESAYSDPQWIQIDLGATYTICHVTLTWETAAASAYQIQTSPDAATWTSIYSTITGAGGVENLSVSGTGRYIRMNGSARTTAYGYSLWEFAVNAVGVGPTATVGAATATPTIQAPPTLTATPIPAFMLISPADGAMITNTRRPTLTWNALAGTVNYQVWVNITRTDYDFSAPGSLLDRYTQMGTVTGTTYTLTTDLSDRWTYKWYVVTVNGSGQTSNSNILTFSVYLPVVTTVNDGIPIINGMRDMNKDGVIEPYEDWHQPVETRVNDLLSRMTVLEEAYQMFYNAQAQPLSGWYFSTPPFAVDVYNSQLTTAKTRLGIPFSSNGDTIHGYMTSYPTQLGLAATRDWHMGYLVGDMQRRESVPAGIRGLLGPLAEVDTKVLYPRFQEGNGENAQNAASMVRALIDGLQGGPELNPSSLLVTTKHWPGEGAGGEAGITYDASSINYHMIPWKAAFEAGAGGVMPGYAGSSYLDPGGPGAGNSAPIINYLRNNMNYDGLVTTDWLPPSVWVSAALAGSDVMGGADPGVAGFDINAFIAAVPKSRIDDAVRRILRVKIKMGLFENPYGDIVNGPANYHTPQDVALVTQAARELMTVLKNDGVLPLRLNAGSTLLVTGARANDGGACCIWTSFFHPEFGSQTMWQWIQTRAQQAGVNAYLDTAPTTPNAAVVIVGEPTYTHGTNWPDTQPYLPADQLAIIQNLRNQNIPTVVVYIMPRPYVITAEQPLANAIIVTYRPGEGGSQALAELLFGDYLPMGKLPMQLPHDMNQVGTDVQTNQLERWDLPYDLGATDAERQDMRNKMVAGVTVPSTYGQPLYPYGAGITGSFGLTDATAPVGFGLTAPANGSTVQNTLPTLSWGASSDPETGIQNYQIWMDNVNIATTKSTQYALPNIHLTAGTHSWYVVATNWANGTTKSNTFTFNFQDSAAPNAFDLVAPASGATVTGSTQTLVWQSSTDAGSGLDHYEVWLDGANVASVPSSGQVATTNNLALNQIASASSTQVATNSPPLAFDGSLTTRWESQYSDPQWLQVDLGKPTAVTHVTLNWETAYATAFKIQVSNDATTWTDIYSTTTGTGGVTDLTGLKGYGRYVRMYGITRATAYGYSLWEFAVYGVPTESTTRSGLAAGTHSWYIVAVDAFGNKQRSTSTFTFTSQ